MIGTNPNMPHGPAFAGGVLRGAIARLENAVRFHRPETGDAVRAALAYYFATERDVREVMATQPITDEWRVWADNQMRNTQKLVRKARALLITRVK